MSRVDLKANLSPPLSEARLARQYAAIRARAPAAPRWNSGSWRGGLGWAAAAMATALLAVVLVGSRTRAARTGGLVDQTVLESGPADPVRVTLGDGSRLELNPSSRARLTSARPTAIRVDLERGGVEVEATHVEGRTFVVGAGAYEVSVVGTHFAVTRDDGGRVAVRVDRGIVEVTATTGESRGESRRLGAGEQWSGLDGPTARPVVEEAVAVPAPVPTAAGAPVLEASESSPGPTNVAAVAPRDDGTRRAPAPQDARDAKQLFDEAQRARTSAHPDEAARAFDRLRRAFPHDPRAALAAFELGRLRLDVLGDPRGAEEALRDALALGPSSPFREDAEARHVEALGRMGDSSGCELARSAYLARWPKGTYRRAVELCCGTR
jgi:transmembrane sensor